MCQLRHRNMVHFIGAVTEPPDLCIITEYCECGALSDLLLDPKIAMDFKTKLKFCCHTAAGMAYMHECNPVILHRDLKSDNLLVTKDWTVKVRRDSQPINHSFQCTRSRCDLCRLSLLEISDSRILSLPRSPISACRASQTTKKQ